MTRLERLLSTNMAILAVVGAAMLGLGQQDAKLALLVLIAAIASVVYTDRRKVFSLNHHLANVAAMCAVGLALFDYSASDRNQQLLAIANLLVYLQVVVFFQEKNARIFGQLAMLSLLQVVVAAALNYSIVFGILIVLYMAIGLPTLSLFFFYRELARFVSQGAETTGSNLQVANGHASANSQLNASAPAPKRRWPLAAQAVTFSGADFSEHETAFGRGGLKSVTARMTAFTLLVTVFVFIFAPRFGRTPWQTDSMDAARIVGYSEEVTLGELGGAVENPETVMRVHFYDEETEEKIHLTGSPLFRGSVVASYDLENRRWSQYRAGYGSDPFPLPRVNFAARNLVRQEISLEALSESAVFAVFPVFSDDPRRCIVRYDDNTKQLFREERDRDNKVMFNLWTTGIKNYRQERLIPAGAGLSQGEQLVLKRIPRGSGETDPFAGLKRVADEAVAQAGVPEDDLFAVAKALESYMLTTGKFKYSIEAQERPNNKVDPIEDFVTRSRVGHCEYFASALALMLRHRGIPCRVVIGFKGGDWNTLGKYYQVRQLHAHAWVEAYFKRNQLVDHKVDLGPNDFAAWLTLDSTADIMDVAEQAENGMWAKVRSLSDYVQMQWITYVVGLSREQQQEHIFKPLQAAYEAALEKVGSSDTESEKRNTYVQVYQWLKRLAGGDWFSWRGLLITMALLLMLAGFTTAIVYAGRRLWRIWSRRWPGNERGAAGQPRREVDFYLQLEKLLARHGYRRTPNQTQREFAAATAAGLATREFTQPVSPLPQEVVDAFYAVRFGGQTLDNRQTQAVEQALVDLKTHLAGTAASQGKA